jgi:type III pantothenate kinase
MKLLIDIGNTSLKWAVSQGRVRRTMRAVRHHGGMPIDLQADWEGLPEPDEVLVSNVGGQAVGDALARTCRSRWGCEARFARTERRCHGVTIAYDCPDGLGVDRWLAMLAAHRAFHGPVVIVDAGTAVTYDLLRADGRHLGGLILPGIGMMFAGLLAGTQIPHLEPVDTDVSWATDTATAVTAGAIQALSALAERLFDRLLDASGSEPQLILTGGDAERLLPVIARPTRCEPDIVLQGLSLLLA